MGKDKIRVYAAIGAIIMSMTACGSKTNEPVSVETGTTLPVEAYTGDVKYSYLINENGETITVATPDIPSDDKFTEIITETTALPDMTDSYETIPETTEKPANSDGDSWMYEDFKGKDDKKNTSKFYPLKAVMLPDTFEFTKIKVVTGQTEKTDPVSGAFKGYELIYTEIDLAEQTVLSMDDYGYDYRKGNEDVQEYSDDNFYYWGCDFDYASLEAVENNKAISSWDEENKESFNKPLKAFMTTGDTDAILYGGITPDMDRDDIESILGKGYEVDFVNNDKHKKGTTVYYQNSKSAFVVSYVNNCMIDSITIVIKGDKDVCEAIPQPEKPETTATSVSEPTMDDVTEEIIYDCPSFKAVYQVNKSTRDDFYIFYIHKKDMDVVDKAVYDTLMEDYNSSGYNVVIVD